MGMEILAARPVETKKVDATFKAKLEEGLSKNGVLRLRWDNASTALMHERYWGYDGVLDMGKGPILIAEELSKTKGYRYLRLHVLYDGMLLYSGKT